MRIPSQFNEDSLYRRGSRRDESAQAYRRLIRLVIGLALVIVVMRQASRPAIYQTFFGSQAARSDSSDPHQQAADPHQMGLSTVGNDPVVIDPVVIDPVVIDPVVIDPVVIDPTDRRIANELVEGLLPADQRGWVVGLSRWQSGRRVEEMPSTVETVLHRLTALENISDQQRLSWEVMLDSFVNLPVAAETDRPTSPTSIDRPRVAALLAALDEAAAARVVDGSVWRAGDFDAFYRYLDQADLLSGADVAATGVLPLLQQPDVFRNQLVRAHGGVARERIVATENPYGITEYWQLWLRPSDGADRPLVAVVPAVPDLVGSVGADAVVQDGPQVTIVGRFLKRLAYKSAMGADLAPVVVGRILSAPVAQNEAVESIAPIQAGSARLWLTMSVACLIGFAVAAIAMWRTSVMAKRARELRTSHRAKPNDFLSGLGDSVNHGEPRR